MNLIRPQAQYPNGFEVPIGTDPSTVTAIAITAPSNAAAAVTVNKSGYYNIKNPRGATVTFAANAVGEWKFINDSVDKGVVNATTGEPESATFTLTITPNAADFLFSKFYGGATAMAAGDSLSIVLSNGGWVMVQAHIAGNLEIVAYADNNESATFTRIAKP